MTGLNLNAMSPPANDLSHELLRKGKPVFEAVATNGTGVFDTLKAVAKQVLTELRKGWPENDHK
ncbi:MAG: hypothetical protein WAU71_08375 [Pyrinomonadaceae bacterium]